MRLNGANDFLEPVAVSPTDACRLRVAEPAKPIIPFQDRQISQPPALAARQDDDGLSLHRPPHQAETVVLRPRGQANTPTPVALRGVREMLDGEDRFGEGLMAEVVKQAFELAVPPAPVARHDVRGEEDEGAIRALMKEVATHSSG